MVKFPGRQMPGSFLSMGGSDSGSTPAAPASPPTSAAMPLSTSASKAAWFASVRRPSPPLPALRGWEPPHGPSVELLGERIILSDCQTTEGSSSKRSPDLQGLPDPHGSTWSSVDAPYLSLLHALNPCQAVSMKVGRQIAKEARARMKRKSDLSGLRVQGPLGGSLLLVGVPPSCR